jgi:bifunctional DNA-binding transcriptional regulator/antitoxin component of YhaV-PrlF toxin-antitoxin module
MDKECYPPLRERGTVTAPEDVRELLGIESDDRLRLVAARADSENQD